MNATLRKSLSRQIPFLESCKRLVREVRTFEAKLLAEELTSMTVRLRILDMNGFAVLLGKVSTYAINLMVSEWAAACLPKPDSLWQGSCLHGCLLLLRYSLPCRHWRFSLFLRASSYYSPWSIHVGGFLEALSRLEDGLWGIMMQP
jgi:hypothetical protein